MGRHRSPSSSRAKVKAKFQLNEEQLFQKHTILNIANHCPTGKLYYYNSLENGLEMALHECPKHLDWRALRRGVACTEEDLLEDNDVSEDAEGDGGKGLDGSDGKGGKGGKDAKGAKDSKDGKDAKDGAEKPKKTYVWEDREGGVPARLLVLRRHYRRAEDEIRSSFFVPGFWSRSGAKQDLAESLRAARDEVMAAIEKCRCWWTPDLIIKIDKLSQKVSSEILEPVLKSDHGKDYHDITNKTDEFCCILRQEIQAADRVRKEFISLAKDQVAGDLGPLRRAMHKHFDWEDVEVSLRRISLAHEGR